MSSTRKRREGSGSSSLSQATAGGIRKTPVVKRSAGAATELSFFQQAMIALRAHHFGNLNQEFQQALRSMNPLKSPEECGYDPHHPEFSKVELLAGWYRSNANEIVRRFGGEAALGGICAFGLNDCNQLGFDNNGKDTFLPRMVPHLMKQRFRQVEAGGMHSVALSETGEPWTWGVNDDGSLGRPTNDPIEAMNGGLVTGFNTRDGKKDDGQITQVSAGESHTLFLSLGGDVYSCGMFKEKDSEKFRIAEDEHASVKGTNPTPQHIWQMPKKAIMIFSGGDFAAAILEDRSMVTWGFGHTGELGRSMDMTSPNDKGEYDLTPSMYKKAGGDGREIVDEAIVRAKFLTPLPPRFNWGDPKKNVLTVGCGMLHMLVVAEEPGSNTTNVYSAGHNGYGQLGHGDTKDRHELTLIKKFEGKRIAQVAGGEHFSMALCILGKRLYTFGRGDKGCLGIGPLPRENAARLEPVLVPFVEDKVVFIEKIAAGDRHAFAITPDHEVYSWGFEGVTGHKGTESKDTLRPRKLDISSHLKRRSRVFDVSGGGQHSMAIAVRYGALQPATPGVIEEI